MVAALDDSGRRSGRRHHKQVVIGGLGGNGNGRGGGDRAGQNLQAPVLQGVVGVDALLGVMLIVLELPLKDIAAVGGVDLLDGQLLGVLNGLTVNGSTAGNRANAADLDGGAGISAGALTCCLGGSGGRSSRGSGRICALSVDAVEPQAARLMTIEAASTELTSFFICTFPPDMQAAVMGSHNPCRFID